MKNSHIDGSVNKWHYLGIDEPPPSGKMHVLTVGLQSTIGDRNTQGIIAWAPLMKRDKTKEAIQIRYGFGSSMTEEQKQAMLAASAALDNQRQIGQQQGLDSFQMKAVDSQFLRSLGIEP